MLVRKNYMMGLFWSDQMQNCVHLGPRNAKIQAWVAQTVGIGGIIRAGLHRVREGGIIDFGGNYELGGRNYRLWENSYTPTSL